MGASLGMHAWKFAPVIRSPERMTWMLDEWETLLGTSDYLLQAEQPTCLDLGLYGIFQMAFCGLSEMKVASIMQRPRLVAYIERMNRLFPHHMSNYCSRVTGG